jgi:hypothetical protein
LAEERANLIRGQETFFEKKKQEYMQHGRPFLTQILAEHGKPRKYGSDLPSDDHKKADKFAIRYVLATKYNLFVHR